MGCDSVINTDLAVITLDTSVSFFPPATLTSNMSNASYQWILCHVLNIPAQGAIFQSFTPTNPGSYAVVVSSAGCVDTSGCHTVDPTSLGIQSPPADFQIFPNPTNGSVQVNMESYVGEFQFEIIDPKGAVRLRGVIKGEETEIDVSGLVTGLYFLRFYYQEQIFITKIRLR